MWANAQRDGRPAEYSPVQRRSLADAQYWSAVNPVEISWGAPN